MMPRILVVDDKRDLARGVAMILSELSDDIAVAHSAEEALVAMERHPADVMLTDVKMPGMSGEQLLAQVRQRWPRCRVLLFTAFANVESAVRTMRLGAVDYITKPFDNDDLLFKIKSIVDDLEAENRGYRDHLELTDDHCFHGIFGCDKRMLAVFQLLQRVAPSQAPVMVCGESGTGKELVVRALHSLSPRKAAPLVAFNASALPDTLAEAELFGARKGAYTGAVDDRHGLFVEAHGGTLFIDELESMSLSLQGKLLRAIQEREVRPIGGAKTVAVDVRLVSALNDDPQRLVREGVLRADLYYRLSVVRVHLPPLRERSDDIPLLARLFLSRQADRYGQPRKRLAPDAMRVLLTHDWPGNVRELQNVIERSALIGDGEEITAADIILEDSGAPWGEGFGDLAQVPYEDAKRSVLEGFQRRYVQRLLAQSEGNITAAAREAKLTRAALYRLMKRLDIAGPEG